MVSEKVIKNNAKINAKPTTNLECTVALSRNVAAATIKKQKNSPFKTLQNSSASNNPLLFL